MKIGIFLIGKHDLCSEGRRKGISVDTICVGKMSFLLSYKLIEHYKNTGVQRAQGKTKNSPLRVFLEGVSKRVFTICNQQKLCSAKTLFV